MQDLVCFLDGSSIGVVEPSQHLDGHFNGADESTIDDIVTVVTRIRITDDAAATATITAAANGPSQPFLPHGDTPTVPPYDSEGACGPLPSYIKRSILRTADMCHTQFSFGSPMYYQL
jgi:hypothetical protein